MVVLFLESELVSGFMTEHAAVVFVFFFLAEYGSIVLMCILNSLLFLGGYLPPIPDLYSISYLLNFIYNIAYVLLIIFELFLEFIKLLLNFVFIFPYIFYCVLNEGNTNDVLIIASSLLEYLYNMHELVEDLMDTLSNPKFFFDEITLVYIQSLFIYYSNLEGLLYGITLGLKSSIMIFTFI